MGIISKLFGSLNTHASGSEKNSPSANQPFSRIAESGRIIRAYSGVLPCTKYTAQHLLRCEHLRDLPGEKAPPYKVQPEYTHQIWIWYRTYKEPEKLNLVFRGQFDFNTASDKSDVIAAEITDFLAYLMLQAKDPTEVLRNKDGDVFWAMAVERKFNNILQLEKK
ncbi:MAG: hypothetical protein KME08_01460 [Aphanothece sp. CMT-3BRIN-NPC111]|jgi:hypothetical protein|nr:hypothetical protein [Aphanothece sp. CMT-3BRIN-NPC111]